MQVLKRPTLIYEENMNTDSSFALMRAVPRKCEPLKRLDIILPTTNKWEKIVKGWKKISKLTLSFFFLSGVMKPFLAFLALEASSMRLRTSALLRSISACLAFFA